MESQSVLSTRRLVALIISSLAAMMIYLACAATAHAATAYDLWVEGSRVTSDNASAIISEWDERGQASFRVTDDGTYELTLTDVTLGIAGDPVSDFEAASIYTMHDLVIVLEGDSRIVPFTIGTVDEPYVQAICARGGNVTFAGTGSLDIQVTAYGDQSAIYGMWGDGSFRFTEGASLSISALSSSSALVYGIVGDLDKEVTFFDDSEVSVLVNSHEKYATGIFGGTVSLSSNARVALRVGGNESNTVAVSARGVTLMSDSMMRISAEMGRAISASNVSINNNATLQANAYNDTSIDCANVKVTDHGMLMATGYGGALSHTPNTTGHYNPRAYVGVSPSNRETMFPITSDITTYDYVQIPGAPIIGRIAGDYANETAALISKGMYSMGGPGAHCQYAVLARDDDFADALGATGLAGALRCPILLTDRTTLSPAAAAEIGRLGIQEVYIIGGPGAMKEQLEIDLYEQCDIDSEDIHRIYGENSYDTSLACAKEVVEQGGDAHGAIIAMSTNFQDALSMSPLAYAHEMPVILQTWGDTAADRGFTDEAREFLTYKDLFVAGGPGAISDESLAGLNVVDRLWGETGYDTSAAIAEYAIAEHALQPYGAIIACGAQAPKGTDALAGSALAGMMRMPILLVNGNEAMEPANTVAVDTFFKKYGSYTQGAYVLGGTYVVPPELYAHIQEVMGGAHDVGRPF